MSLPLLPRDAGDVSAWLLVLPIELGLDVLSARLNAEFGRAAFSARVAAI
jgi:hypothetical protein